MISCKILKCTCDHKSQDELHGKNMRVFNKIKQSDTKNTTYRCTVCLKLKDA